MGFRVVSAASEPNRATIGQHSPPTAGVTSPSPKDRKATEAMHATKATRPRARARTRLKDELRKIERLKGTAIIELEGTVVTVYRPDRVRFRKLRGARGRPRRRTGSDEVGR